MVHKLAQVAIGLAAYSFDKPFTYNIPIEMRDVIKPGARVIVPFGRGNRKRIGLVLSVEDANTQLTADRIPPEGSDTHPAPDRELLASGERYADVPGSSGADRVKASEPNGSGMSVYAGGAESQSNQSAAYFTNSGMKNTGRLRKEDLKQNLKTIDVLIDNDPLLTDEQFELMLWLKQRTFCTYYDAYRTFIPAGMNVFVNERYSLDMKNVDGTKLTGDEAEFINRLQSTKTKKEFDAVMDGAVSRNDEVFRSLIGMGVLKKLEDYKQRAGNRKMKMLRLSDRYLAGGITMGLPPKNQSVIKLLEETGSASHKEVCSVCGVTAAVLKGMVTKGLIEQYERDTYLDMYGDTSDFYTESPAELELNKEQMRAYDEIAEGIELGQPKCFLLHGVTGSGKTSVFKKLIDYTLRMGKQAMLLVPEIALTPQMLGQFRRMFGEQTAVIHSDLPLGMRMNEFKRIKACQAKIVIGTRSAVFAPLENIGIIIMDEEGERSYKSDASPRYNTVDVAKKRCMTHNAVLVLSSATPTVESYYQASKGRYKLIEIKKRYREAPLPNVHIVDMAKERISGNASEFSLKLTEEIRENIKRGEQTILLLNRRGYNSVLVCTQCYEPISCPHCSVPLTYHKAGEFLLCHYCGHSGFAQQPCKKCGNKVMRPMGFGTQKIEEQLQGLIPDARILRMDSDTTSSRHSYEQKFKAFADGDYDIMLGTQMISKGLDFPNVTLVGVVSVDKSLLYGDFRSYERTFSLITQVVGRSGRGEKSGRAYLQTFQPDNYIIQLASRQAYKEFYNEEIQLRRALIFPPICDICTVMFVGESETDVQKAAAKVFALIKEILDGRTDVSPLRVFVPTKCPHEKINGKYHYRIIMKCKNTQQFREFISKMLYSAAECAECSKVAVYPDINGELY
ncbi:MAG: primosomal protein N' [Oscillospiraceae bacterium]|jgi:primosomal protein N' (replication factor Y)|nr:primosomal protein N' [Oscillospiraceae bacterium]